MDHRPQQAFGYAAGKVALITGSSRGIGRTLALSLATQGGSVVVNFKQNEDLANEVVDRVEESGGKAIAVKADIEDPEQIHALFDAAREAFGRLDYFVSNAAASSFKPIRDLGVHNLDRSYAMNIRAFVLGAQQAVELMNEGGRIVALSSYGAIRAYPTYANLGAAKAALEAWVRYMAIEWAPLGINVNAVNGGLIDSDSLDYFYAVEGMPSLEADVLPKVPKARRGTVKEVADCVEFMLEPRSEYVTGQSLVVDGGLSIVSPPFFDDVGEALRLPTRVGAKIMASEVGALRNRPKRVGVLIPASNTVMEVDLQMALQREATVHTARMRLDEPMTPAGERAMLDEFAEPAAEEISAIAPDLVVFGCTSAGTLRGLEADVELRSRLAAIVKCRVVGVFDAMAARLRDLGVCSIGLLTPYTMELTQPIADSLDAKGFEVRAVGAMGRSANLAVGAIEPAEIFDAACALIDGGQEVEALAIGCTNLRAMAVRSALEGRLQIPVVTANSAVIDRVMADVGKDLCV